MGLEIIVALLHKLRLVARLPLKFGGLGLVDIGWLRLRLHLRYNFPYVAGLETLLVLGFRIEGHILWLILIILIEKRLIRVERRGVGWRLGECGLVAGLDEFWIIAFLHDLGRLHFRLLFDGMRLVVSIVRGLGLKFELGLVAVVRVNASAIFIHGNKYNIQGSSFI